MKVRFSFRYKFLAVIAALLGGCLIAYAFLAVRIFQRDKTELVYDLNRSAVTNIGSELDTRFRNAANKMELFAALALGGTAIPNAFNEILERDSDLVYLSVVDRDDRGGEARYSNQTFLETYGIKESFFEKELAIEIPVPHESIQKKGSWIWNASSQTGPLLIGYGLSVIHESGDKKSQLSSTVIAYLRPDSVIKDLTASELSEISIVDSDGRLLIHPKPEYIKARKSLTDLEIFQAAAKSPAQTAVMELGAHESRTLGAFRRIAAGQILVLGQTAGEKVSTAISKLVQRSLHFAVFVVTLSLLVALLFSSSLMKPLTHLTQGMEKVAEGDLSTQIEVRTGDELALLAGSFNHMIDDLRKSRAALEEANRGLEQKVAERTRQLEEQNRAVQEAQEALLRTTRLASIGEIAGRTAHEILNPLTGILARLEKMAGVGSAISSQELSLLRDILDAWTQEYRSGGFTSLTQSWQKPSEILVGKSLWDEDLENLQKVLSALTSATTDTKSDLDFLHNESQRIVRIINRMRSLSQPMSHPTRQSLSDVVGEAIKIMSDWLQKSQVRLTESFDTSEDWVEIDRDEFLQVLTNLIRNSLQAMESSGAKLKCLKLTTRVVRDQNQILVEIEDNGPGIDPEHQRKLFESQFTTKGRDEGTGLGLSISRRFVRAVHGDLFLAESRPFECTRFSIVLPLVNVANKAGAA